MQFSAKIKCHGVAPRIIQEDLIQKKSGICKRLFGDATGAPGIVSVIKVAEKLSDVCYPFRKVLYAEVDGVEVFNKDNFPSGGSFNELVKVLEGRLRLFHESFPIFKLTLEHSHSDTLYLVDFFFSRRMDLQVNMRGQIQSPNTIGFEASQIPNAFLNVDWKNVVTIEHKIFNAFVEDLKTSLQSEFSFFSIDFNNRNKPQIRIPGGKPNELPSLLKNSSSCSINNTKIPLSGTDSSYGSGMSFIEALFWYCILFDCGLDPAYQVCDCNGWTYKGDIQAEIPGLKEEFNSAVKEIQADSVAV